jgi:iron-sulfur cluster repair protein YtfE (RIC family)
MLRSIGRGPQKPASLVDSMLDCHERIRRFVALACAASEGTDARAQDVIQACDDVERYFTKALPLHVADEEQSVLPRVLAKSPDLAPTLATMQEQHVAHGPKLEALLHALSGLRASPDDPTRKQELSAAARALEREFAEHLALEEQLIFPVLDQLDAASQAEIAAELRLRRR